VSAAVVIGGGYSGLVAARRLLRAGVDVVVCEARDRVGGRAYTKASPNGTALDLGGQWIGGEQERVYALARELGAAIVPVHDQGRAVIQRDGRRWPDGGDPPGYRRALAQLDRLAAVVSVDAPWDAPQGAVWDGQTFRTWLDANAPHEDVRWLVQNVVEGTFAADVGEISLLHVLFGIASAGGTGAMFERAEQAWLAGGAQTLADRMADELGDRVRMGTRVDQVSWTDGGVALEGPGLALTAEHAIVALSPHLAGRLRYSPPLPGRRDQLTQSVPMGAAVKLHCLYNRPFWRPVGLSGDSLSDGDGLTLLTRDSSPGGDGPGVLTCLITAGSARRWLALDNGLRRGRLLARLADLFGDGSRCPVEVVEKCWPEDPFSGGAYDAHFPPGVWTSLGDALRAPIGPLHWAGSETAARWCGYLDGAISAGERAADEVLGARRR